MKQGQNGAKLKNNEGRWEAGGRFRRERQVYLWLIHVDVWQKLIQYCKAIILQLKKNNNKGMEVEGLGDAIPRGLVLL